MSIARLMLVAVICTTFTGCSSYGRLRIDDSRAGSKLELVGNLRADSVLVMRDDLEEMWLVSSIASNVSPSLHRLAYGVVPIGWREAHEAIEIAPGHTYTVTMTWIHRVVQVIKFLATEKDGAVVWTEISNKIYAPEFFCPLI